jgi:hypothetical protein
VSALGSGGIGEASDVVGPPKGVLTGEHFVEQTAEGPDVGAPVDDLSARLFGAHVGGRSDDKAFTRAPDRLGRRLRDRDRTSSATRARPKSRTFTTP